MFLENTATVIYGGIYHYRYSQKLTMLQPSDEVG